MTEGMEGHVFDHRNHVTADAFANIIEQLCTYVGATFKDCGSDIKYVVRNFKLPTIDKPKPLPKDADEVDKAIWKEDVKTVATQRRKLKENTKTLYSIIWGQCLKTMIEKSKRKNHSQPLRKRMTRWNY